MEFNYTEENEALKEKARKFAKDVIAPEALEYDRRGVFPHETIRKMGKEGFFGPIVPKEYGGLGLSTLEYCLILQEIASASPAYTHNGIYQAQKALILFGTKEQKEKYLSKLAIAEYIGAIAISERNVGSSFKKMETTAVKKDDRYIINGHKTHINDAAEAHVMPLLAQTENGLTMFIIEKGQPGIVFSEKLDPIGYRASPIYEFSLENAEVKESQRLGEEGKGLKIFFEIFNFSRIGNASVFIGMANGALEEAVRYAREREVGTSKVIDFQGIRWLIAELCTRIEAATLLRDKAAVLESSGSPCARETCMAKFYAGEVARDVTNKAIEICGSYGCYRERPFEMLYRDAKALLAAGGSSEVMKNVIADLAIGK